MDRILNSHGTETTVRLGVISDTHGELAGVRRAVRIFREQNVRKIIHCGDIGGVDVVELFRGIETHFVYGNTDGSGDLLRRTAEACGGVLHGWSGTLEWMGKRIFFLHGHKNRLFEEAIRSGEYDLVCYGHTHLPAFQEHFGTLLLNPGAFQRVVTPSIAVVTLPEMIVESFAVE